MTRTVKYFVIPAPLKYCGGRIISDDNDRGAHCDRCGQRFLANRVGSNCAMKNRGKTEEKK